MEKSKLLLLGISGMDYKVTRGLMAAGRLPVFRKLAERGSFVKLDPIVPADDGVSWCSLSTGLNPGKHGIFDALQRNPQTYTPEWPSPRIKELPSLKLKDIGATNDSFNFELKPVWKFISEAGFYSSAAHWPVFSTPAELLQDNHGQKYSEDSRKELLEQASELEQAQQETFWQEFSEFEKQESGFIGFKFDALNQLQRLFWNDRSIGKKDDKIILNQVVAEHYGQKDALLGKILERTGQQTTLLVVSNHGITSFERSFHLNTWLIEQGYMQLTTGPNSTGLKSMDKNFCFNYVDWDTTRAYALGFTSIYLNLEQREGQGIVTDQEPLLKELIAKLEQVIDHQTKERIIHKVYRKEEIYTGKYVINAPDLIVNFKPGYQMSWPTAIGGFGQQLIEDNINGLTGNHLVDSSFIPGILLSNKKFERISAHCLDISPTILQLMGIAVPTEMDGKSLL